MPDYLENSGQATPDNALSTWICWSAIAAQACLPPQAVDIGIPENPKRIGFRQNTTDACVTTDTNTVRFLEESPAMKSLVESVAASLIQEKTLVAGRLTLIEDPESDSISVRLEVSGSLSQDELDKHYLKIAKNVDWRIRYKLRVIAE